MSGQGRKSSPFLSQSWEVHSLLWQWSTVFYHLLLSYWVTVWPTWTSVPVSALPTLWEHCDQKWKRRFSCTWKKQHIWKVVKFPVGTKLGVVEETYTRKNINSSQDGPPLRLALLVFCHRAVQKDTLVGEVLCSLYSGKLSSWHPTTIEFDGLNFKYYSLGYKRKMEVSGRGAEWSDNIFEFYLH